jgi:hypothetical protein
MDCAFQEAVRAKKKFARTRTTQFCVRTIGADREESCACTAPVMTALASANPMKMLLKIEAVTKKRMVRMTAPRIQHTH